MFKRSLVLSVFIAALASACATVAPPAGTFVVNGAYCYVAPPDGWHDATSRYVQRTTFIHDASGDMVSVTYQPQRYVHEEYALAKDPHASIYVRPPGADRGLVRLYGDRAAEVAQKLKLVCSR